MWMEMRDREEFLARPRDPVKNRRIFNIDFTNTAIYIPVQSILPSPSDVRHKIEKNIFSYV